MASDGKVVISTALDNKGLEKGLGSVAGSLGGLAKTVTKTAAVITTAFATAAVAVTKMATDAYADYEQLTGGVETLFKASADKVKAYAEDAFYTVGISANEYMATVTSFSASLISSLGGDTEKAADVANMALVDMSDNANKMGTNIESIKTAYQGFAKQNYTMLDNLKLGYGGTKTEMERLLKDAQALTGVKYDISNLSDVYTAIHAIQENLGIAGTTAKEAEKTISGSANMTKAAWKNVLAAIAGGGDLDKAINNLVYSISKYFENIVPVVERSLAGIGQLIEKIAPQLVQTVATALIKAIPSLLNAVYQMIIGLAKGIYQGIVALFAGSDATSTVSAQLSEVAESASDAASAEEDLASGITEASNAAKKSLAGFDELNKLQDANASTGSTPGGGGGTNETTTVSVDVEDKASPALESFADRIKKLFDPIQQIDLTPAKEAFAELGDSVSKFTAKISDKLEWAWFNILVPLGKWTIEKAVPKVAELLAKAFETFGEIIDAAWPALEKLWENFLKPLAEWTGDLIIGALEEVTGLLSDLGDLVSGKLSFSEFLSGLTPAQTALASIVTSLITIKTVAFGMKSFKAITDFVKSIKSLNAVGIIGKLGEVFVITSSGAGTFSEAMKFAFGKGASIIAGIAAVAAGITLVVTGIKDFINNGASLKNMILIIGGAIATAVGLATMGIGPLIAAIVGLVTAVAAFTAAILLEEPAIMSVEEAQKNLTAAKAAAAEAENGYINAVDAAESALTRLKEAEEAAGVTGADLYAQVQDGTLDYADMTAAQKEVYKAYLDNEQKQKDLKAATEELNAAKKAETLASYENQLALAKESGNYDDFKKSVVEAFEAGELSAEEARELIGKSMSEMSDDAQKTFMEDLPGDIKQGLDPSQYETTRKKLGDWFKRVGKGFIENIWNPVKDFWNNHIAKFFTAKWWGDLAKNAINGFLKWIFGGINSLIDKLNSFGFELPDILGGGRIGFNIKKLDVPQLAKGAVLPANKPFLAMVGDQKHGTNIEAPLATIQEAVALVMEDQTSAILAGFEASVGVQREILEAVLGIQIGDDVIGQATARYNRKLAVMRGGA